MKHVNIFLIIALLKFFPAFSQDTSKFELLTSIQTDADFFTTDNQSNIYVVKANVLTKFDKTGKLLYKYSDKKVRIRLCSDFAKNGASKRILTFFTKLY